jgi:SAM-dependent methyltransferase
MHADAITRWEERRLAMAPLDAGAVHPAEQAVREVLEDVRRIASAVRAHDAHLSQLSEGETQLLTALKRTVNRGREPNHNELLQFGRETFQRFLVDWDDAFEQLADKGLVTEDAGLYGLTPAGRIHANIINQERPIWRYLYNELYLRAEESETHSAFCEQVHGKNLCQLGQADMDQIHSLIDALDIQPESRVLDLGCGNGRIAEYVSDQTGAHVTGIDVADEAIRLARTRTMDKQERLTFRVGNVGSTDVITGLFDVIIAIDCLHMTPDLADAVRRAVARLKPGGRMGVFWESWIRAGTPATYLEPDHTRLARVLNDMGRSYATIDFSEANLHLWQRVRRVMEASKAAFEAEGNALICETTMDEANRIDRGTGCRYLYLVG